MYLRKYPKYRLKTILHHPRRVENSTGNAENMSRRLTFVQPLPRNIFPAIGVTDTETKRQGWIYTYIPLFLINFKRWIHELILVSASCNLVIYIWLKVGRKKEEKAKFVYKDRAKTCLGFVKSASFINYPTLKD